MSRGLQSLFEGGEHSSLYRLYLYFLVFFGLKFGALWLLQNGLVLFGLSSADAVQVFDNSELFLQSFCLLLSLWLVFWKASPGALRHPLGSFLGAPRSKSYLVRRYVTEAMGPLRKAFAVASVGVLLLLVLGGYRLEGPILGISWMGVWAPAWILEGMLLALWVLVLEIQRQALLTLFLPRKTPRAEPSFVGRLILIFFESFLIFSIFAKPEQSGSGLALLGLSSLWLAVGMQVWAMYRSGRPFAAWKRVVGLSAFLWTLTGLFGLPVGGQRFVSLYSVFPSEGAWLPALSELSFLENPLFLLLLVAFFGLMLRRVQLEKV